MIKLRMTCTSGETHIEVSGHHEPGEAGPLVCAAVSALTQGFFATLKDLAESYPEHLVVEGEVPRGTLRHSG